MILINKILSFAIVVLIITGNFKAQINSPVHVTGAVEFTSSNLPIVVIDTHGMEITDLHRIMADMGIIYNGEGTRNYLTDPFNGYDGKIAIELRGSATSSYPKKQYRFETQDELGDNLNVSLIDLPKENDWIFYGPYDDQSLIRNVLAYGLSNDLGRYASRTRFCELVLNSDYRGLYVLMEKIKQDKNRVNISEMDSTDIAGDQLSGGYIIKIDKWEGENVGEWRSKKGTLYQYHYPKADQILLEQKAYIQNYMNEFESVMDKANYADIYLGYPQYIDIDSFIDHFIINEFCKNVDAYRISAFMYKDRDSKGGKLTAGPIWDFNLSFGKAWYPEDLFLTEGWQVDYNSHRPWDYYHVPFWWEKLSRDPNFVNRIELRWFELRKSLLQKNSIFNQIDYLVKYIEEARNRNFERWPQSAIGHTYDVEILVIKHWISDRIDWIDQNIGLLTAISRNSLPAIVSSQIILEQNHPNPFNSTTRISYQLHKTCPISLKIYSLTGKEVRTLVNCTQNAGWYSTKWDGNDNWGHSTGSGVYIYILMSDKEKISKKILRLK